MDARALIRLVALALLGLLLPTARAELSARIAAGNPIDVEDTGARPEVETAELPGGTPAAQFSERQARATGRTAQNRVLRDAITMAHQAALRRHVDDYSRTNGAGDPVAPVTDGPVYVARAFAMIHVAMFDAFVGIGRQDPTYLSYSELPEVPANVRFVAQFVAIGEAARIVTDSVFPEPQVRRAAARGASIEAILQAVRTGLDWGRTVAAAVIADRNDDGAFDFPVFTEVPPPQRFRDHRPDPEVGPEPQLNFAAHWGMVDGFGYNRIRNPRRGGPNRLGPPLRNGYQGDIRQVLEVGENTAEDTGDRSADQTEVGIFWAYDGSFGIGVPPRLYNDAIDGIIATRGSRTNNPFRLVKLYAIINVALSDAGVVSWREKYRFNFWRPTVGLRRERRRFSGGLTPDAGWQPLGVPKTNSAQVDVFKNPSFPAYPSGHATFGAAALTAAQTFLGIGGNFRFSFVSAEFDGEARPASANNDAPPRPRTRRSFTINQAIEENNISRVYLGVHWAVDSEQGAILGKEVGRDVAGSFPAKI